MVGRDPTGFLIPVPRPMDPERCVELLRGITSESRDERWGYADIVGEWDVDWWMVPSEAAPLAAVLGWAALLETDKWRVRADLMFSLNSLAQADLVPRVVLEQVTSNLSRQELDVAEVDSYDVLVDKLRELPAVGEPAPGRSVVGPGRCVRLVRGLTSRAEGERATWAGVAIEWVQAGELADHEAGPVAAVLGWAALVDEAEVFPARERLLRALTLLAQADLAPTAVLAQVTADLPRDELNAAEAKLFDALVDALRRRRGPGPPERVARCVGLLRGITSQYHEERFAAAAAVAQHHEAGELDAAEAAPIAAVLGWAAVLETDTVEGTRARLLGSLAVLARAGRAPLVALEQVRSTLPRAELDPAEVESYDVLVDQLRARGGWGETATGGFPVGPAQCVRLVRGLVTQSPTWAGVAGRWLRAGELSTHEATTIAAVLGWAALLEPNDTFPVRYKVLHSLTAAQDLAPTTVLEQVTAALPRAELDAAEAECYDLLADQLRRRRTFPAP